MKTLLFASFLVLISSTLSFAHGDEEHEKADTSQNPAVSMQEQTIHTHKDDRQEATSGHVASGSKASMNDFPTLHPLVVHFPIVLLLLAALAQLFGFFLFRKALSWTTLALLFMGLLSAFVAGQYVHPHTEGLSQGSEWVLGQHEAYADYTIWAAAAAFVLKLITQLLFPNRLIELVTAIALIASSYFVSVAGHYGAQLTHIEGIGPQGQFISTDTHNHKHE